MAKLLNPLAADFFFATLLGARSYFFYIPSPGTELFPCLLFGTDFFLGYSCFPGWNLTPPQSTVQGKSIYTIFKAENQEIQFPLLCTKHSKFKHKFFLSKVGSPEADLSAIRAKIV